MSSSKTTRLPTMAAFLSSASFATAFYTSMPVTVQPGLESAAPCARGFFVCRPITFAVAKATKPSAISQSLIVIVFELVRNRFCALKTSD